MPWQCVMSGTHSSLTRRRFLFLQGPITPFFSEVAAGLRAFGHRVFRINLNLGDRLFWHGPDAVDYTARPEEWPSWIADFLKQNEITDILLLGEQRFYHSSAIEAAKALGIAVTVTDFGYLRPDWITLERNGMGGDSLFPRNPAEIRRLAQGLSPPDLSPKFRDHFLRQAFWDVIYHVAGLWPFAFRHYHSHQIMHPLMMYAGLGRRLLLRRFENRRSAGVMRKLSQGSAAFWIFAMQMETDFSLRAYSAFPDMDTPLRLTINSFAAHAPRDAALLIKLHPLDPCVKHWPSRIEALAKAAGIAGRVHWAPLGKLDDMLVLAKGFITVNSTAATRAMILGKPVKLLGKAVYDVPGLAHQGSLDSFWADGIPPDQDLLQDFLALLCEAFMVRGVFYHRPGLNAAVAATVARLDQGLINLPSRAAQAESAIA